MSGRDETGDGLNSRGASRHRNDGTSVQALADPDGSAGMFFVDHGLPANYRSVADCHAAATAPKEGNWSAFVALAWIATGSEKFVAAAQAYESQKGIYGEAISASFIWDRPSAFSAQILGGLTFTAAEEKLMVRVQSARLLGGDRESW